MQYIPCIPNLCNYGHSFIRPLYIKWTFAHRLQTAKILKVYACSSFTQRSPNGTQPNFATCLASQPYWKWTWKLWGSHPWQAAPKNCLILVILRRHISLNIFVMERATDKRKRNSLPAKNPLHSPKICSTFATNRWELKLHFDTLSQLLPPNARQPNFASCSEVVLTTNAWQELKTQRNGGCLGEMA